MPIRTVLIDLGNVLMNFSHQRMCQQMADVYQTTAAHVRESLFENRLYQAFDRGEISEVDLHAQLENVFGQHCPLAELQQAAGDIFEPNLEMLAALRRLSERNLRLVLLSNTCPTHINWIRDNNDFLELFDELVLSYEVGACKPESAIFQAALQAIHCAPDDCFYTDDIAEYVVAARAHGLVAEVFENSRKFIQQLKQHGIEIELN